MKRIRIARVLNNPVTVSYNISPPLVYLHLALAVFMGGLISTLFTLLLTYPFQATQAAPLLRPPQEPLRESITATTLITHTEVTTHRMSVFGDGRISNQFFNSEGLDQIDREGDTPDATTLALWFEQHGAGTVDVGVQGEFMPLTPITLNTPSALPGYIEDTYAVYASRVLSYQIIQRTLAPPNANWVTIKLVVKNTGTSTLSGGKMLLMVDLDGRYLENGDLGFYDEPRQMVGVTDGESNGLNCGMALSLLEGSWYGYGITGTRGTHPTTDARIKREMDSPIDTVRDGAATNHVVWIVVTLPPFLDGGESTTASFTLGSACQDGGDDADMRDTLIDDHDEQTTFSIVKSSTPENGDSLLAGTPITYRVSIAREGPGTVDNVRFTDTVPALTELLTYRVSQGAVNAVAGTVTATLDQIASDTPVYVTMVVASLISVTDGISITNQAQVQGASAVSPTQTVTSTKRTNQVIHYIFNRPIITLTKRATPTSQVKAGERLTYTLALTAGLEGHIVDGVVSDTLPPHTQFVPGSIRLVPSTTVGIAGIEPPTLTHGLTLRPGERATVTFAVTVTTPLTHNTIITNTAIVTAPHLAAVVEDTITHTVIYTPVLRLYKTSYHPIPLSHEDLITYTIVAHNQGNAVATGGMIRDLLSPHTQYISNSLRLEADKGITGTSPPVLAHALTLKAGSAATVTFGVTVTKPLSDGVRITNTATLTSAEIGTPVTATVVDVIGEAPELHIRKTMSTSDPLQPGNRIAYTIVVSNRGDMDATDALIFDELPTYTVFVPGSLSVEPPIGDIEQTASFIRVYNLPIARGSAVTVAFAVDVAPSLPSGTGITNTATVTSSEISTPITATVTDFVESAPVLHIRKFSTYTNSLFPGSLITYTILISNSGNTDATGAVVFDPLPAYTRFVSDSLTLVPPTSGITGTQPPVIARNLTIGAGGGKVVLTFAVRVTSPLTDGTSIVNTVRVTSTEVSTPTTATVIDIVSAAPLLELRKVSTYASSLFPGDRITYTIVARNNGNANATGAVVNDPLPAHTQFVTGSLALDAPSGMPGTGPGTAPPNLVHGLTLAADGAATVTFAVTVTSPLTDGTPIVNMATLTSTEVSTPTTATVMDIVSAAPLLELRKVSTYASPLFPGDRITYTIVARNSGNANATGAVVNDPLPAHTQFVTGSLTLDASSGTPGTGPGTAPPNLVHGLTLAADGAATVTFAVMVTSPLTDGTPIVNTATLTSTEVSTPTTATVTDTISTAPLLTLRKVSTYTPPLHPGDRITYTIVARNRGYADATGGVIRDPLPAHTRFVTGSLTLDPSASGMPGTAPPNLVQDLTLPADGAATVTFAVTVTTPLANGTPLVNTATLTSTEVSTPTTATVTDIVSAMPLLVLHKASAYVPPLHPGDRITYTIVARNSGNANATGGVINDPLPAYTQFVGRSLALDPPDTRGTLGTGPPDLVRDLTLVAGEDAVAVTITFAVTVTSPLTDDTPIANTATLTSAEVSTPTTATVTDIVSAMPLLALRKASAYAPPLHPGDRITYTIVARNSGNANATGAVINDPLPAHTQFVGGSLVLDPPNTDGTLGAEPPDLVRDLTLVAGEDAVAVTITFAVTVTSPLTDDTPIANTATFTCTEVSTPAIATVVDTVSAAPLLKLRKVSTYTSPLRPGDRITYTIMARNSGYADATGGVIRDPLPAHTRFVTGSLTLDPPASGALGTAPPNLVRDLTLTADGGATITFAVTVTSPLTDGTLIVNTATLTSTEVSQPLVATAVDTVSATSPTLEYIALTPQQRTVRAGERVTYTVLAVSSLGDQWDVTSEASFEIEASAGGIWIANTYMSQLPGIWTVTATLQHLSDTAILEVEAPVVQTLYLPILVKQLTQAPDLSITHLIATQTHITMVVQNVGNAPVVNNFWVDAYVDPDPIPSAPNDIWQDFADQGLVWGVTEDLLPGATLVLTEGSAMPWITRTLITWPLRIGTPIYAQVDSAYVGQSYGAVLESHEILGGSYTNNIAGPVNVAASAAALPICIPAPYRRTVMPPFWKLEAQLPER